MSLSPAHVSLAAGLSLSLLTCVAVAESSGATAPDGAAVEILPPGELWEGVTRGEWDAQWWQRVFTMPEEINPYFDPTGERCGYQQSGPGVILPGNFAGGIVERTCVVAEGTAIYVHVAGATCSTVEPPPYYGRTEDELRACASASFDNDVIDFEARVDGQDVADLNAYRTTSPMFTITSPVDNPLGIEPGVGQMVSEAISFIIAPPPPGEYEIEVSQGGGGVTNTIIVEAPNAIDTPMSSPVNSAAVSSWEPGAIEWTETRPGFEEGYLDVPIDCAHPDDGMLHGSTLRDVSRMIPGHMWARCWSTQAVPASAGRAAVCYTSGTTGHPKGAMQSHRAVISAAVGTVVMGARGPDDRVINSLPLAHVYGSCVFNAAMMAGSTLIMVPRFDAAEVMAAIAEHRAALMDGVPTAYYYLLAHPDFDDADLSSLTRCWVGGQTLPEAKAIEFTKRTGCPSHEVWGMTELAGAASADPVVGPNKPGMIGIAYPGNAMRVVDIDDPHCRGWTG